MKDIDKMLGKSPKPARELSEDFTQKTIVEIKSSPAPAGWLAGARQKVVRHIWLTSFAGILLLGGSAAAIATLWPTPKITPILNQAIASGNHIVGYDAVNCDYFNSLDGHTAPPASSKVYYEIRKDAKLTDQQMQETLQGICEENISNNVISRIEKQLPNQGSSTEVFHIDAMSSQGFTLSLDPHYDKSDFDLKLPQTYSRFSSSLVVYDENTRISFNDLKPGDSIKFIYNDTSGQVQTAQNNYVDLNHPQNIVISAVLKVPPLSADPDTFFTHFGTDFVGVNPCSTSPTGFCRSYNFDN